MARPSKAERRLISSLRDAFGVHISTLLLCGYGEERTLSSRDFLIESAGDDGRVMEVRLISIAEGPANTQPSLPHRKEPLVLLALLHILLSRGGALTEGLSLARGEVADLLGWNDTAEFRAIIAGAVTKYFHTYYQRTGPDIRAEKALNDYTLKSRIINCYGFRDAGVDEADNTPTDFVNFNGDFVESLSKRNILKIDWHRVKSVTPLPVEFFNL